MQIDVKTLTGATVAVEVKPSDTFDQVQAKIRDATGLATDRQRFLVSEATQDHKGRSQIQTAQRKGRGEGMRIGINSWVKGAGNRR